MTLSVIVNSS